MKVGSTLYPFIHFSMGEKKSGNGLSESAHIMFPLFRIVDQFVETGPGQTAPVLGQFLNEPVAAKIERISSNSFRLKRDCTYSFSFESKFLDFALWNVCSIPGLGSKSFTDFFGSQPVKIVAYDLLPEGREENTSLTHGFHYEALKQYLLLIKMTHISVMPGTEGSSSGGI